MYIRIVSNRNILLMKPKRQENLVIARIMDIRGLGSGGVNYSSHLPIWKSANTTKGTF